MHLFIHSFHEHLMRPPTMFHNPWWCYLSGYPGLNSSTYMLCGQEVLLNSFIQDEVKKITRLIIQLFNKKYICMIC